MTTKPIWIAVDPADTSGDYTAVTALVYRITGRQQFRTFTLIEFRAFILNADVPISRSCVSGIGGDDQGVRRGGVIRMQRIHEVSGEGSCTDEHD